MQGITLWFFKILVREIRFVCGCGAVLKHVIRIVRIENFLFVNSHLAVSRKIHRCFERVNQLLSLLVSVSDINRAALGRVAAHCAVAYVSGIRSKIRKPSPNYPPPIRASGEV
jgi:hypothetical protein